MLPYPPQRPDLAPSDFHLIGPMKNVIRGRKFRDNDDDDEVIKEEKICLRQIPVDFYQQGIKALVSRWRKAVETYED